MNTPSEINQAKTGSGLKKAGLILLSFFIPFIIILLGYIALHITPFGEHTLLVSDARALYASDLGFISRALRGQEDVLYSFKSGIGMNLMGANSGLLNPANVISLFFDITNWPAMYSLAGSRHRHVRADNVLLPVRRVRLQTEKSDLLDCLRHDGF